MEYPTIDQLNRLRTKRWDTLSDQEQQLLLNYPSWEDRRGYRHMQDRDLLGNRRKRRHGPR